MQLVVHGVLVCLSKELIDRRGGDGGMGEGRNFIPLTFALSPHPGSGTVSSSFALLRDYEHQLKDLVRSKFTEARDSNRLEGIERYVCI